MIYNYYNNKIEKEKYILIKNSESHLHNKLEGKPRNEEKDSGVVLASLNLRRYLPQQKMELEFLNSVRKILLNK